MTQNRHIQVHNPFKRYWANHRYKDRLFRRIFKNKDDLLQLYNAINNTSYTNPEDLIVTTLDDTIILSMKNDLSFIITSSMNLYEHQSTFNPNMPIRGVFYFSRLYEVYIALHKLDMYGSSLIKLPTPQYVIFYNGDADKPDRMLLKLSDAFELPEHSSDLIPALECTAIMLTINYRHNEELLNKCRLLKEYSIFTSRVKDYRLKGFSLNDAVNKAIDECIKEGVLMDILLKHRTLARNSILTEYDEKKRRKLDRQEGYREGMEFGMECGIERGIEAFILDNLEEDVDQNRIINKLMLRFQLDEDTAKGYLTKYKQ